jgi:Mannosyltransferase (PIG-V)
MSSKLPPKSSLPDAETMPSEIAFVQSPTGSCNLESLPTSSAVPSHELMSRSWSLARPLLAGLVLTALQLTLAVGLLAPEGPASYRFSTLIQHDSYWFMNIVDRGYQTIVPPINQKMMEVSNVAFFPAYPAIAAVLRRGLNVDTGTALLITAQLAAWGFWSYFFLLCRRWRLSSVLQVCGASLIVAHPAAFFLIAGYSESLFLMTLLGFIYWSSSKGRSAKVWAALHGIVMSATRIVGIMCAAFPVVQSVCADGWKGLREPRSWFRRYGPAVGLMIAATLGALGFFLYCQLRWGRWDIYMLTQAAGWAIVPDYLAVLKPSSYRWLIPELNNPTEASQMSMSLGALLFVGIALCELLPAIRQRAGLPIRVGIYFCAAAIYYLSVSGVACVDMESMLRYEFCVHALIVLALLNYLRQFRTPPMFIRAFGIAAVALVSAAGLSIQGWYLWNFTRGNWVA